LAIEDSLVVLGWDGWAWRPGGGLAELPEAG